MPSRKHFVLLAEELKLAKPSFVLPENSGGAASELAAAELKSSPEYKQWKRCVQAVASACCYMNPRFDESTFYAACGSED